MKEVAAALKRELTLKNEVEFNPQKQLGRVLLK